MSKTLAKVGKAVLLLLLLRLGLLLMKVLRPPVVLIGRLAWVEVGVGRLRLARMEVGVGWLMRLVVVALKPGRVLDLSKGHAVVRLDNRIDVLHEERNRLAEIAVTDGDHVRRVNGNATRTVELWFHFHREVARGELDLVILERALCAQIVLCRKESALERAVSKELGQSALDCVVGEDGRSLHLDVKAIAGLGDGDGALGGAGR